VGGLIFSMTILFIASSIVSQLIERATWLLDVAGVVLGLTAANLILEDKVFVEHVHLTDAQQWGVRLGTVALVLIVDLILRARRRRADAHTATTAVEHNGHKAELHSDPLRTMLVTPTQTTEPTSSGERSPRDVS